MPEIKLTKEELASLAAQTIVDKPLKEITVRQLEMSWIDKHIRKKPEFRRFSIYRARVCNMGRCADVANRLPEFKPNKDNPYEMIRIAMPLVHNHRLDVLYIVASCIQNNSKEPKKSLIRFIDVNFDSEMLFDVLLICLQSLGLQSFWEASLLIKGQNAITAMEQDANSATIQD